MAFKAAGNNVEFTASHDFSLIEIGERHDGARCECNTGYRWTNSLIITSASFELSMTASLDGNAGAYHALLERLTGHLRAYYRRRFALIGHGHTEAEDLLQEALIAIHTHRGTYDPLQPFTPWVYAIARYKFLD
jgi:hypothetical protein